MDAQNLKQQAIARARQLEDNRLEWESLWKDISEYILPRKGRFSGDTVNKPKTSPTSIVDATATKALRGLASGMHSGMTSPTRPWFRLAVRDSRLARSSAVSQWLGAVQNILYDALARSNFYASIHTLYTEEAAFGTGALYQEEHPEHGFVFRVLTTGTYALGMGDDGRADSLYRTFWMSAKNVVSKWGKTASRSTQDLAASSPDRFVEVCHLIYPRQNFDPAKKDRLNMPFESLYWEKGSSGEEILSRSGFHEFPVMCPRWDVTAEDIYGQSPGLDALPDVKMLQQMAKGEIMALHKMNTPPMAKPAGYKARLNLTPGGENVVNITGGDASVKPLYEVRTDIAAVSLRIEKLQAAVREWFFNDLFLLLNQTPNMTATEVMERHEEKLLLLGPVIERQQYELLDPLIDRTFNTLLRNRKLPPPPAALMGQDLKVDYISLLAQAQKMAGLRSLESATQYAGALAQVSPQVLDRIDTDAALTAYADIVGLPANVLRGDDDVQRIRKARALQMAQAQAAQVQAQAAGAQAQPETGNGN